MKGMVSVGEGRTGIVLGGGLELLREGNVIRKRGKSEGPGCRMSRVEHK